jgi:alpha-mannosidase
MPDFIPYTRNNLDYVLPMLEKAIYTRVASLDIQAWRTDEPVPFEQRRSGQELNLQIGDSWGGLFDCAWFHFTGQIPTNVTGFPLVLILDVNGEMLVVDRQGNPLRGLTNVSSGYDYSLGMPGKRILPLSQATAAGGLIDVWADAGCNDLFGNLKENGTVKEASLAILNEEARALYYDYEVLLDFLKVLPTDSPRAQQILNGLNSATWKLATGIAEGQAHTAREILRPLLSKRGGDPDLNITAIGHAHIDLAWLWPLRETKRKGARTFATALANMETYPDYHFGASQPQLFQWIKDEYPHLYARVKQQVKRGRFEVQGAMWVEADTNVSGGEALVRQILYGKRFFQREFGVNIDHLWLPDVFGYSAALPQILRNAGVNYFMTQKLSWNQINKFPHHSFHWQGIDGSSILAHMLPEETYNSPALPRSVHKIENNYHEKGVSQHSLMLFGIGDGGGGPGEEHIERIGRIRNLSGLSPVRQEPAANIFPRLAKEASRFPTWVGELYLERHSGTLTTEAKNKWFNRRMEQSLRELEWTALLANSEYPSQKLEAIWKEVLLYQFHDILPGSSIKRVYDESLTRYREMYEDVESMISQFEEELASTIDTAGMQTPNIFFNSLSWPRKEWRQAGPAWKKVTVPAMGYQAVDMCCEDEIPSVNAGEHLLENDLLRVRFAEDGSITSIFDKEFNREILRVGQSANHLAVYRDPGDAWDFPLDYANQSPRFMRLASSSPKVDGPRAALVQVYRIGSSELVQEIALFSGSRRLDFYTRTRWREQEAMLRTSFPVAVHTSESNCEIQFGHIQRPTHRNTSWDLAKDEIAAHKWVDLSQRDYGVALLNDSKYGHRIKDGIIDLNLLRSVPYPGYNTAVHQSVPEGEPHPGYTDQADHVFSYALFPHPGDLVDGGVIQAGYEFNFSLRQIKVDPQTGKRPGSYSLLTVDSTAVIVEAVKQAEDSPALIIRLYEAQHTNALTRVQFGFAVQAAYEASLMEEPLSPLELFDNGVILDFHPFEIKTLIIQPAA